MKIPTFFFEYTNKNSRFCKGRVVTKFIENKHKIIKHPSEHSHAPVVHDIFVAETNSAIKITAKNTDRPPSVVLGNAIVNTDIKIARIYLPKRLKN